MKVKDLTLELLLSELAKRDNKAHKNHFGHVLVIGGSKGMTGAAILASHAAMRAGAGLVTAATWKENYNELTYRISPEVMTQTIEDVVSNIEKYDGIVLGPGLGQSNKAFKLVSKILQSYKGSIVLDADGINVINKSPDLLNKCQGRIVITPHIGEFSRLINIEKEEIEKDPSKYIKQFVDKYNSEIVLKSFCTYISIHSKQDLYRYESPNSGLAKAGSGDVLAGILGGLLVSNDSSMNLCLGVVLHSLAGEFASHRLSPYCTTANALLDFMPMAFLEIINTEKAE